MSKKQHQKTFIDFPLLLTAEEAARVFKVSKCTILRLANKKKIQGTKIGSQWRFSQEVLLDLLNGASALQRGSERVGSSARQDKSL